MIGKISTAAALATCLAACNWQPRPPSAKELKVTLGQDRHRLRPRRIRRLRSERVRCFYTSDFGPDLKPADKDGKGKITKVSLDGKILEDGFLPAKGQTLNKPKGIWISGNRLWVTDIDSVWVFDLKTKEGKKLDIPGIVFANDPTVVDDALYVSDNRSDQLFSVEPADFLKSKKPPKITVVFKGKGIFPNGLYPGKNGSLVMVGMESKDKPHGIYQMAPGKEPKQMSDNIGLLDGLYRHDERRHHWPPIG